MEQHRQLIQWLRRGKRTFKGRSDRLKTVVPKSPADLNLDLTSLVNARLVLRNLPEALWVRQCLLASGHINAKIVVALRRWVAWMLIADSVGAVLTRRYGDPLRDVWRSEIRLWLVR